MKSIYVSPLLLSVAAAAAATAVTAKTSYDGSKVIRVAVGDQAAKVSDMISQMSLSKWEGRAERNGHVDLVVPQGKLQQFEDSTSNMDTSVMLADLGAAIAEEGNFDVYRAGSANETWFNSYHAYDDHIQFLNDLQAAHPDNSEIVVPGKSGDGRDITGIHFYGDGGKGSKPAIVLHGTVHAREWITTMVVEYLAYNLLSNFDTNADVKNLVNKYDFYIFPIVNPDGFVFTQTTNRLWRKNRQRQSGSSCIGRDINRNWPYKWDVPGGASTNPCDETFKGRNPNDAPETKVLAAFLDEVAEQENGLKLFIDYHSYSQLLMTPYGYSCTALATNNAELQTLAQGSVAAIRAVFGTVFETGPICSTIYPTTGSSVDYATDVSRAQYTFTYELRDTGRYGFVLPPDQILDSAIEAYAGFRHLLVNMR
ncbi:MAG: hypothetical protein M1837_006276 [Sclerophora amabilis]|nr:MAG: hypothetical protein M1837_006276 [Sclerophora amabilis]